MRVGAGGVSLCSPLLLVLKRETFPTIKLLKNYAFGGPGVSISVLKRCEMTVFRKGFVLSISASITWVWSLSDM